MAITCPCLVCACPTRRVKSFFQSVRKRQPSARLFYCLYEFRSSLDGNVLEGDGSEYTVITLDDLAIPNVTRPLFWWVLRAWGCVMGAAGCWALGSTA